MYWKIGFNWFFFWEKCGRLVTKFKNSKGKVRWRGEREKSCWAWKILHRMPINHWTLVFYTLTVPRGGLIWLVMHVAPFPIKSTTQLLFFPELLKSLVFGHILRSQALWKDNRIFRQSIKQVKQIGLGRPPDFEWTKKCEYRRFLFFSLSNRFFSSEGQNYFYLRERKKVMFWKHKICHGCDFPKYFFQGLWIPFFKNIFLGEKRPK